MEFEEITAKTRSVFEEEFEPEAEAVDPEPEEDRDQEETPEEPEEDDEEEQEEEEVEEEEEQSDDEEEEEEAVVAEHDIDVQAFLAKYGGDINKALKGAADLYHVVGRQGQEKAAALARAEELEAQLQRMQAFSTGHTVLTEEQRDWATEAAGSENPAGYVQLAVDQGEFDLARAVCEQWAREDPFNAGRVGTQIDAIEAQVNAPPEQPEFDMASMLDAAKKQFPDMPLYQERMAQLVRQLGDDHYLVAAARSSDVNEAARGIVGLYDYAKSTSVNVREAKEKVRAEKRQNGSSARAKAVVSSATTAPSVAQTPRQTEILPGLTLEALEAEFARRSE